jgi:hypothetical protein
MRRRSQTGHLLDSPGEHSGEFGVVALVVVGVGFGEVSDRIVECSTASR